MENKQEQLLDIVRSKMQGEIKALNNVYAQVDDAYAQAIEALLACKGRVVVTGLGKTGHIGKKIAASFASLGTPAFFVHSCESLHGDMGMITGDDVVIMISNSGKSGEILNMLPSLKIIGPKTISITRDKNSPLGKATDIAIQCDAGDEIDHMNLAPTSSAIAALMVGDALATAVCEQKGFERSDFALSHPGGALGQALLREYEQKTNQA